MSKIQLLNMFAFVFTIFIYRMLSGEGRHIKSPEKVEKKYVQNPFLISIKNRGNLIAKSDHSEISLVVKTAPTKTSADFLQIAENQNNFPFLLDKYLGRKTLHDSQPMAPRHSLVSNKYVSSNQLIGKSIMVNNLAASAADYRRIMTDRRLGAGLEVDKRMSNHKSPVEQKSLSSTTLTHGPFFSESSAAYMNNFWPTPPSSNPPHVGHLETIKNLKEIPRNCLSYKCTNHLRRTTPGVSPGIGHFFITNSDRITSEQKHKHLGPIDPHEAGQTDYFRPTKPGHSPGAGHAILKEKRKLNG